MKITILTENNSRIDNYLLAEPGFSVLLELQNKKILFDTGYSDVFLKNAQKIGINLDDITDIVISHGHNDHTGGLRYFNPKNQNIKLTAHPNIFDSKVDENGIMHGCPITKEMTEKQFALNLTSKPYYVTENLLFLGEIENNFTENIDDSALVYIFEDELFIITGCSHSGIINIINYAKKVTGINKLYGIIGGMHLLDKDNAELINLAKFFKNENMKYFAPCHCCNLNSKIILSQYNKIEEICVGDTVVLE